MPEGTFAFLLGGAWDGPGVHSVTVRSGPHFYVRPFAAASGFSRKTEIEVGVLRDEISK